MILIDALNITGGGGLVLLEYLLKHLHEQGAAHAVLVAEGQANNYECLVINKFRSSMLGRAKAYRYIVKHVRPSMILCFGNFPPPFRMSCQVYTYFHRPALINMYDEELSLKNGITYWAKRTYLSSLLKYSDGFIFQSSIIQQAFVKTYNFSPKKTLVLPFYTEEKFADEILAINTVKKDQFIYVSNDAIHKNHEKLLAAWELLHKEGLHPILVLTLNSNTRHAEEIERLQEEGVRIVNIGQVSHDEVLKHTYASRYVIFPSLAETLGLGLVEGYYGNCFVLASNMAYAYEVVKPSAVFDPQDPADITKIVRKVMSSDSVQPTRLVMKNKIHDFIRLLSSTNT